MNTKYNTFLVGGSVRDKILGVPSKDVDFLMLAPSFEAMRETLLAEGSTIFIEKPEFLTIRCKHPVLGAADFSCGRVDGNYSDGRRPDSTQVTTDIVQELSRRDFTMNAIAINMESGEMLDPFKGTDDIANKLIRCVGRAEHRLREDKLRAFRAVRFSITKQFNLNSNLVAAIQFLQPEDFSGVATERIREELFKALKADTRATCDLIFNQFPELGNVAMQRGIWFEPSTKQ